jgi:hypothetical protein
MIDGPSPNRSAYLAYLALSYVQIYGGDLSDVFLSPYDTLVPSLFDGQHAFSQIAQELPDPQTLFRPGFIQGVNDGVEPIASQLRENNTFQVAPHAPIHLYYGEADTDVFPQNTHIAASSMRSAGVQVTEVDLGADADHPKSANLGLPAARTWFDEIAAKRD